MLKIMTDLKPVQRLKVDLTLDLTCPYCLVGIEHLVSALQQYRSIRHLVNFQPELRLLPYQCNPTLTEVPELRSAMRERRLGKEKAREMDEKERVKLEALGITPPIDIQISSSHNAQRLLTYTLFNYPDRQLPLAIDLFYAYHRDGRHLSDRDLLSDLAVHHGVFPDPLSALAFLDGEAFDADVKRAYVTSRRLGVTGVPFFVFQDRYAASGAMGVEEFILLIEEIVRREEINSASPSPTSTAASPSAQIQTGVRQEKLPHTHTHVHELPIATHSSVASPVSSASHEDR